MGGIYVEGVCDRRQRRREKRPFRLGRSAGRREHPRKVRSSAADYAHANHQQRSDQGNLLLSRLGYGGAQRHRRW